MGDVELSAEIWGDLDEFPWSDEWTDEGTSIRQRNQQLAAGCLDRDNPTGLSPVFKLVKRGDQRERFSISILDGKNYAGPALRMDEDSIRFAAMCTGFGEAKNWIANLKGCFTVFSASPSDVISDDHVRFVSRNNAVVANTYQMCLDEGVGSSPWDERNIRGVWVGNLLGPLVNHELERVHMSDPVYGTLYKTPNSETLADFNIWELPKKAKVRTDELLTIERFKDFLLPASITYFQTNTCALVMYPDVTGFKSKFQNIQDRDSKRAFVQTFWEDNSGMVLTELLASEIPDDHSERLALKKDLVKKMYGLMKETWMENMSLETGDCVVGIGRILDYNMGSVAHTGSSLPGSSGSAMIPTGVGIKGVFFAFHTGQAPQTPWWLYDIGMFQVNRPDHNIALSVDHPEFVTGYWTHIVPNLPRPNQIQKEALKPFKDWIALHLRLVASVTNSNEPQQVQWLLEGLKYYLDKCNPATTLFTKRSLLKILSSPRILAQLVSMGLQLHADFDEQISFLNQLNNRNFGSIHLSDWKLPYSCSSPGHLAAIASKFSANLVIEEQSYLQVPIVEYEKVSLTNFGIEISNTPLSALMPALAWGFRSLLITSEDADIVLRQYLEIGPVIRESIQILVLAANNSCEDFLNVMKLRIERMKCGYLDVLILDPDDLKLLKDELQALVEHGFVRSIGVRTDSLIDLNSALELLMNYVSIVQVNLASLQVPPEILAKCKSLNLGIISTCHSSNAMTQIEGSTEFQMDVAVKVKAGVVPFSVIQTKNELTELREIARRRAMFRLLAASLATSADE